ncbi:MAG: ACT domain-containing protein [Clostridia bacterium]|nr:ACT domain-containing protein [Clostridia bacterium]
MYVKQLSIFVQNTKGRLADITETLAKAGVDIRAISVADTRDFGILRLIVDKPTVAVETLKKANMTVSLTKVIGVGISDKPGEFAKVLRVLSDQDIQVEYMYAFISRDKGKAFVILRVDDAELALSIIQKSNIHILTEDEIANM